MDKVILLGRILFGGYFIRSGIKHFLNLEGMTGYTASKGIPLPEFAVIITGLMLLIGGLSILSGYYPKIGSSVLIVFLVVVAVVMHDFWNIEDTAARAGQLSRFLRNFTFTGACLMFLSIPEPWAFSLKIGKK